VRPEGRSFIVHPVFRVLPLESQAQGRKDTVAHAGIRAGLCEASGRVPMFSFATQGGKQPSSYFRQRNWVQAREAQVRFPAGGLEFDSIK